MCHCVTRVLEVFFVVEKLCGPRVSEMSVGVLVGHVMEGPGQAFGTTEEHSYACSEINVL